MNRIDFLQQVLNEQFSQQLQQLQEEGTVHVCIQRMLEHCSPYFDEAASTRPAAGHQYLKYLITGAVADYFNLN